MSELVGYIQDRIFDSVVGQEPSWKNKMSRMLMGKSREQEIDDFSPEEKKKFVAVLLPIISI